MAVFWQPGETDVLRGRPIENSVELKLSMQMSQSGVTEAWGCESGTKMFAFLTKLLLVVRSRLTSWVQPTRELTEQYARASSRYNMAVLEGGRLGLGIIRFIRLNYWPGSYSGEKFAQGRVLEELKPSD